MALQSEIFIHTDHILMLIHPDEWQLLSRDMKAELQSQTFVDYGNYGYKEVRFERPENVFDENNLNKRFIRMVRNRYSGIERREREKAAEGQHCFDDLKVILSLLQSLCYFCHKPFQKLTTKIRSRTVHLEHLLPLSKGGSHNPSNLAWVCSDCNLDKGAKTEDEYWTALLKKDQARFQPCHDMANKNRPHKEQLDNQTR